MTIPDSSVDEGPAETATTVVFADAVLPALAAGEYEVEVHQAIAGEIGDKGTPSRHEFQHVQPLRVTGPHFGLGPQDVFSVHPPAGSDADWSGSLPSVVFARRGLPWVIEMSGPRSSVATDPNATDEDRGDHGAGAGDGVDADDPVPWLAVLLLTPEEIAAEGPDVAPTPTGSRQTLLTELLDPSPDVRGPAFTPRQVERFLQEHPPDFTVTTIDVPAPVFSRIAPTIDDLRLLAHTRSVRDEVRTLVDTQAAGDYAVAVGNRLAAGSASGVYIAHLVSLEGFADALPPARIQDGRRLRLISLAGWTFTSRRIGRGFTDVMQGLAAGPLKMPDALGQATDPHGADGVGAGPAPEPWDPAETIRKALLLGYTAVDYRTRLGERTVAWYRGPLLPVAMKPNPQPPFEDAEAALVYDEETGMFDVSFAVAWQTGRSLALADRQIAVELARWVRRARRAMIRALGRDRLARTHPLLAPATVPAPDAKRGATTAGGQIRDLMANELGPNPWGSPIDLSGLLDQVGRMPGLVAPDELAEMFSGPGTPTAAFLGAIRARASRATLSGPVRGMPPPQDRVADIVRHRPPAPSSAEVGRFPNELRALLADRSAAADVLRDEAAPPDDVVAWLDRLALLHTVPFPVLVPDTRALPAESIRFAHLDTNWISALVDGALSVAAVDEPDRAVLDLLRPAVHRALRELAGKEGAGQALSGFLLRSTAVTDWPGLRVAAYADRQGARVSPARRIDRTSSTVLLALFDGEIGRVELATPAQGSGFGVVFSAENPEGEVYLRGLGEGFDSGGQIPGPAVPVPLRHEPAEARILDVTALHAVLLRALAERYGERPVPAFGPGAFGLQLVPGGEAQVFENLAAPSAESEPESLPESEQAPESGRESLPESEPEPGNTAGPEAR